MSSDSRHNVKWNHLFTPQSLSLSHPLRTSKREVLSLFNTCHVPTTGGWSANYCHLWNCLEIKWNAPFVFNKICNLIAWKKIFAKRVITYSICSIFLISTNTISSNPVIFVPNEARCAPSTMYTCAIKDVANIAERHNGAAGHLKRW